MILYSQVLLRMSKKCLFDGLYCFEVKNVYM